jgi:hypothetical protein
VSRRTRAGVLAVAIGIVPVAAGCSAGFDNASQQVKPDHSSDQIGALKVQNVNVVLGSNGSPDVVMASIVNTADSPDTLSSVGVNGAQATLAPASTPAPNVGSNLAGAGSPTGPYSIPAYGALALGGQSTPGAALATITNNSLQPGTFATVTFVFANSGVLTVTDAYVTPATGYYAGITAAPATTPPPTATATATSTARGTATPTGTSTVNPTATATSTATSTATATSTG